MDEIDLKALIVQTYQGIAPDMGDVTFEEAVDTVGDMLYPLVKRPQIEAAIKDYFE